VRQIVFLFSRNLLTEIIRYWGHEHDYRNNLTCIRRGGVVPRQFPCNRKELESLRDGPFSGFLASSEAFLEKGGKRDNKSSEAEIEVLEGQEAQEASVALDTLEKEPPVAGQDAEGAEDELNETPSVAEGDELAESEHDDSGYVLGEEDDRNEPSQWESHILCVADPFVRAKVKAFI
jgi:hypothetical protein